MAILHVQARPRMCTRDYREQDHLADSGQELKLRPLHYSTNEVLLICKLKPSLNMQSDSVCAKVFVQRIPFVTMAIINYFEI